MHSTAQNGKQLMTMCNLLHARPSSRPPAAAVDDDDDEDAPAIVGGIKDDAADLQHEGLRSAFPMAFGTPIPHMPCNDLHSPGACRAVLRFFSTGQPHCIQVDHDNLGIDLCFSPGKFSVEIHPEFSTHGSALQLF